MMDQHLPSEKTRFYDGINFYQIPEYMIEGIELYLNHRVRPGSFLYYLFCNDFLETCGAADSINLRNLPAYAFFMKNFMPSQSFGSAEKVEKWLNNKD